MKNGPNASRAALEGSTDGHRDEFGFFPKKKIQKIPATDAPIGRRAVFLKTQRTSMNSRITC